MGDIKMTKPIIVIHNIKTDEYIEREMNELELQQFQEEQEQLVIDEQEKAEAAEAKAALLERLGITEVEAKLLLS
jgi:hypothetical protein